MDGYKYIAVEGLAKSGKTRLAAVLAEEFHARLLLDNSDNPFIDQFYENITVSSNPLALKTQLIYLIHRFHQQQDLKQKDLFQTLTVSDYIFYKDGIYAHTILGDEDLEIYKMLYNIFAEKIMPCGLVIYLQTSFAEMIHRIHKYGSEAERKVPSEYWRDLFEAYNYYFFNFKLAPLLVVNVEKLDFENRREVECLVREIKSQKKGITYYAPA